MIDTAEKAQRKEVRARQRSERWWLAGILLLALVLRVIFFFQARSNLYFNHFADSLYYQWWAQEILQGHWGPAVFFQGPLYPYIMALIYAVFGVHQEAVLFVQVIFGTVSCAFIYLLGRLTFGWTVGALAALIGALYSVAIFYEGALLMGSTLYALHLLLLVTILWALRVKHCISWTIPGLLLGLSALGRSNILVFLPLVMAGIAILYTGRVKKKLSSLRAILALLFGMVIVLTPVTVHNYMAGHDLVLVSSNLGINFFVGNNPQAEGFYEKPKGLDFDDDMTGSKIASILTGKELKPSEVSRFWLMKGLDFVKTQPKEFLKLTADKFLLLWNSYEIPQAEDFNFFRKFVPLFNWPLINFAILGPLGLLGILFSLKRWKEIYFLLAYVFSMIVGTILFFVLARFRIQLCSVLMVFAAVSIVRLWEMLRARQWQRLAWAMVVLVFFTLIVNWPRPQLSSARDEARSRIYLAKYFWLVEGNLEKASEELNLAVAADSLLGETYLYLAKFRLEQGDVQETFHLWRKAIQMDPQTSAAHLNVGNLYKQMGLWDQAILEYRQEISVSPYSCKAYEALSHALAQKEKQVQENEKKSNAIP